MALSVEGSYLYARHIAEEEDYNGFLKIQSTIRGFPSVKVTSSLIQRPELDIPWFVPKNVRAAVEAFWMCLPPVTETLERHTRMPVDCAFKTDAEIRDLIAIRVDEPKRPGGVHTNRKSRLKVCLDCIEEDRKQYGYAYWHRLALMSGIEVCPRHSTILYTLCDKCEFVNETTKVAPWIPGNRCRCNGPLTPLGKLSKRDFAVARDIAEMVQQLLTKEYRPQGASNALVSTFKHHCTRQGSEGRAPMTILREMFLDNLGENYLKRLDIRPHVIGKLLTPLSPGKSFADPFLNIIGVYAAFGGWQRFEQTTLSDLGNRNESELESSHEIRRAGVRSSEATKKYMKEYLKGRSTRAYRQQFSKLSAHELDELKTNARTWLTSILEEFPCITRTQLYRRKRGTIYLAFLRICDEEYYQSVLPDAFNLTDESIEKRVAQIYARRAYLISTVPGMRVTMAALRTGVPMANGLRTRPEELKVALSECIDSDETYNKRLIPHLCRAIRSVKPKSRYGIEESFLSLEVRECNQRIKQAKRLLRETSLGLATAVFCHIREGRRRR
ncbi:TniQ family protein [Caballeronia sp. LZ001]|uniref:TniQ family protein n=1 Tax=Caballeronia sp. LZ001 TaxID=3038553 RepID=UPI002855A2A3|nr:TniQ family protein [Caballeronia sp. LZ001]MDR5803762.1 hypothetical protein [Caballeronia sp. LZ001]